jgi:tetratricopeptide (TPR) repeat protein
MKRQILVCVLVFYGLINGTAEERRTIEEISYDIFRYPNNIPLYFERANAYIDLERYSDALSDITMILTLEPSAEHFAERSKVYYDAFYSHNMINDPNRALLLQHAMQDINRAIELNPNVGDFYRRRGEYCMELDDFGQGIEDTTSAIKLDPQNSEAYALRGCCYLMIDQFQKCLKDTSAALALGSTVSRVFYWRSMAYANLEEIEQALHEINHAIVMGPDSSDYYRVRSILYNQTGNYREALNDLTEYFKGVREPSGNDYKGMGSIYQGLANQEKDIVKKAEYQRKAEENFAIAERMGETR